MSTGGDVDNASRRWSKVVLGALPLIGALVSLLAVFIYALEYISVDNFFGYFGVAPEDVGINEIELLTRTGAVTLAVLAIFAGSVAFSALLVAVARAVKLLPQRREGRPLSKEKLHRVVLLVALPALLLSGIVDLIGARYFFLVALLLVCPFLVVVSFFTHTPARAMHLRLSSVGSCSSSCSEAMPSTGVRRLPSEWRGPVTHLAWSVSYLMLSKSLQLGSPALRRHRITEAKTFWTSGPLTVRPSCMTVGRA